MEKFVKYPSVGNKNNIRLHKLEELLNGKVHVFHKLDGANCQACLHNGEIVASSRNNVLNAENSNQGFYQYAMGDDSLKAFFRDHPSLRLYGEWLVPHTFRAYRQDAWREFYVFDVLDSDGNFLSYEKYAELLTAYGIKFIPCLRILENPTTDELESICLEATFLTNGVAGEGIVIKNYQHSPRSTDDSIRWLKMVGENFKPVKVDKPLKVFGHTKESLLVDQYLTIADINKEVFRIQGDYEKFPKTGIEELFSSVYKSFVDDNYLVIQEAGSDLKLIKKSCGGKVRELFPQIFK